MVAIVTVLKPIVYGLDAVANGVVRLLQVEPRTEVISTFTVEEVEAMVDESHDEGMLDESEYVRLAGALGFTSRTVEGVLLPLDQLETVPRGARATDVEAACGQTGYSRFPVVGDGGELVGYLHIKDVIQADPHGRARVVEDKWIRQFASGPPVRHAGERAADPPGQGRPHGHRHRRQRQPSSAWSPSRTSSRSWSARSATRRMPRATEAR